MTKTVEFFFDFGSPAAYLAWTQMPRIAKETGAQIDYQPFLLGGVFQATANRSPAEVVPKGRYMTVDLERFARRYGVPFVHNPFFPVNTLMLMRGAIGLQMRQPDKFIGYCNAMYHAVWVEARNMNDPAVVGEVLQQSGFDAPSFLALTADPQVKERLKAVTQDAVSRGAFGAPTFFVNGDMFWGQDRLDFVQEALQ